MRLQSTAVSLFSASVLLLFASTSVGQVLTGGGVNSIFSPTPVNTALNLLSSGMNVTYTAISAYYAKFNHCPPNDFFFKEPEFGANIIQSISNNGCDVVGTFSSRAPGPLKNQVIRILPKTSVSSNHTVVDFSFRATITTIGFVNNGTNPSFLLTPLKSYRWSPPLQNTAFGNVPAASLANTLYDSYQTVMTQDAAVNTSSSGTSTSGGPTTNATIVTV